MLITSYSWRSILWYRFLLDRWFGIWGLLVYIIINELINKITTLFFVDVHYQINLFNTKTF
jgi:hypothetical protein